MAQKKDEKQEDITSVLSKINKVYGSGTIMPASEARALSITRLPTGIFELDTRIGDGWPKGRIIQLRGDYSSCKSLVCMKTAVEAQRTCRFCGTPMMTVSLFGEVTDHGCECGRNEPMRVVWLDIEHSFDKNWFQANGLDLDALLVSQSESAEEAINIADLLLRSKLCDLLIVDSIAAMVPTIEVEQDVEKQHVGTTARLVGKALRKWVSGLNSYGLLSETSCTILLVNQERLAIGGFKPILVSSGGKAPEYFESVEVRFKRKSPMLIDDKPVAANVEFVVKKNKTAPTAGTGGIFSIFLVPYRGIPVGATDTHVQVFRLATYWGLLEKGGSWITFPDGTKVQGKVEASIALRERPELLQSLKEKIMELETSWRRNGIVQEMIDTTSDYTDGIDLDEDIEDED
jgi:recombination protein RecA